MRFRLEVLLAAAIVIFIVANQLRPSGPPRSPNSPLISNRPDDALSPPLPPLPLSVAVLESEGCHEEVSAALVYAFAKQPLTNVTLYLKRARFGIQPIYYSFFSPGQTKPVSATTRDFAPKNLLRAPPQVVVLVTGEFDFALDSALNHLFHHSPDTRLLCVIHHADQWRVGDNDEGNQLVSHAARWIASRRITFLTLSPHVHDYLIKTITPTWKAITDVPPHLETLVPVFPVDSALSSSKTSYRVSPNEVGFAIQGNASPGRRNYTKVVLQLAEMLRDKTAPNVRLHLLSGSSAIEQVPIPAEVASHVVIHRSLDYADYYGLLSHTVALLPAFGTDAYYYERASSTVPAALIAGTPIIADQRLLDTYAYLDPSLVWFREPEEDEMDVAAKVARETSVEERQARSARVRQKNLELCRANVKMIARWVRETA